MRWKIINKNHGHANAYDQYPKFKILLAEESDHQCVYCAIHDSRMGGISVFHVEHYKPKCKFPDLENDYYNLFYACPICNRFKGPDWLDTPKDGLSSPCYPNPLLFNYEDIFIVKDDFHLESHHAAGKYIIERIHLNRAHLLRERKFFSINKKIESIHIKLHALVDSERASPSFQNTSSLLLEAYQLLATIQHDINRFLTSTPYQQAEVRR